MNGEAVSVGADSQAPLSWAIKDLLRIIGAKFHRGVGL
jgi:aerobic-type carbon monoxide dehydrogenase small subunit (CoxS/CutS family)